MTNRVFASGSYTEELGILGEHVNIVSVDEWGSAPTRNPPEREER